MASLLDKLKAQQANNTVAGTPTGQTANAAALLAAKSGKAGQAGSPISAEGEGAQIDANQTQQAQATAEGRVAGAQTGVIEAGQAADASQAMDRIALQYQDLSSDKQQKLAALDQQARQAADKLQLNRDQVAMEARLFQRRLGDQKYTDQLVNDRTLQRAFAAKDKQAELTKLTMDTGLADTLRKLGMDSMINADARTWNEKMSRLDLDSQRELFDAAQKAAAKRATLDAFRGGAAAGMGSIGGMGSSPTEPTVTNTTTGTSSEPTTTYNETGSREIQA